jgi:hypothetical protein
MTQLVEEQDRWTEHVATYVTPVTKSQLFELAREEATSASTILRRALLASSAPPVSFPEGGLYGGSKPWSGPRSARSRSVDQLLAKLGVGEAVASLRHDCSRSRSLQPS